MGSKLPCNGQPGCSSLRLSTHSRLCNSLFCGRLESPTRALVMEAPKGIEINAEAGSLKATCRTELKLESKDGEVSEECQALWQKQTKPLDLQFYKIYKIHLGAPFETVI